MISLIKPENRMRIRDLRKSMPHWDWVAERYSMGWRYIGTHKSRHVVVYATSVLCGPSEDDATTEWRADDGRTSESYVVWWMKNRAVA